MEKEQWNNSLHGFHHQVNRKKAEENVERNAQEARAIQDEKKEKEEKEVEMQNVTETKMGGAKKNSEKKQNLRKRK